MKNEITIPALADPHLHFRSGTNTIKDLIRHSVNGGADFGGAMPNVGDGLTTFDLARDYWRQVKGLAGNSMQVLPYLYLTERTRREDILKCADQGIMDAKVYPLDRTTRSHNGVKNYSNLLPVLVMCAEAGMRVHFHPEHPNMIFENRDAEFVFLTFVMDVLMMSDVTIIWEHGTDARCIPHWKKMAESGRFFVTLTAHHLATSESRVFGDVSAVCKPPIKTEHDRALLHALVCEGHPWVMLGSDSAYHSMSAKHPDKGCCACGAFTAPFLAQLCAHVFTGLIDSGDSGLEKFVAFTSGNARGLYRLGPSERTITLERGGFVIPTSYQVGGEEALPFWGGQKLDWSI